jgi:hypothetical protein
VHLTLSSTFTLDQAVIIFLKEIVRHVDSTVEVGR